MGNATEEKSALQNIKEGQNGSDAVIEDQLMKPFNLGWKREVVMRVITQSNNCDIYYLHPNGKKLRSMVEVKANLTDGLTLDCFTFKKKPLNVSSEIVRNAIVRGRTSNRTKTISRIIKSNKEAQAKHRATNGTAKVEKPSYLRASTRRQIMMKKKEQQSLNLMRMRKQNGMSGRKPLKKTGEKAAKKKQRFVRNSTKQNKSEVRKKPGPKLTASSGSNCNNNNTSSTKRKDVRIGMVKLDNTGSGRKKEFNDIRSIVQRNIGKYREMRKNQLMGKLKEGLREKTKTYLSYKILQRQKRSEPISKNLQFYLKPLERGWRRELVHRVNGPFSEGRADVYYYHPNGKKLRSAREISKNLTQGLTLDCFTFRKEALGCGEPHETIRNARLSKVGSTPVKKKIS